MVHHAPLPQMLHVAVYPTHRHLSGIDFLYAAVLSLDEKLALVVDSPCGTRNSPLGSSTQTSLSWFTRSFA